MSDKKAASGDKGKKPQLTLTRTVGAGKVQQTVARGRLNTVTVEVKKTRTFSRDGERAAETPSNDAPVITESIKESEKDALSNLTNEERESRLRALKLAEERGESETRNMMPPPPVQAAPKPEKEKEKKEAAPAEVDMEPQLPPSEEKLRTHNKSAIPAKKKLADSDDVPKAAPKSKMQSERRNKAKLTINNAFDQEERMRSLASLKRARQKAKRQSTDMLPGQSSDKMVREVIVPETITVQELANRMAVRSTDVVKELMKLGIMAAGNQSIDADTAELLVNEFGHTIKRVTDADVEDILKQTVPEESELTHRAPVVTVMGHVDHGKTSLLDALRSTNVTDGEAGGITQHIGAYQVKTEKGDLITFLDTPGHAAFTAMRARGAKVTDIVVLIVAADDGIMPQTIEAINHAKAANVPIIVAVNKIDKPDANPQRIKEALLSHELIPEDMGGDVMVAEVSALQRIGLDHLIDIILLQSEMLELQASTGHRAAGTVIEARVDKGKGVVVSLLVQQGTLRTGDIVIAGTGFGRVKAMADDKGHEITEAGPSVPVEILGLNELPAAGDEFAVVEMEKHAREIIEYRVKNQRDIRSAKHASSTKEQSGIDRLFQNAQGGKELRLIIKGDVQGSIEAIIGSLEKLNNDEISVKVVHSAAGGITESDVTLASTVGAMILGFNVRAAGNVRSAAEAEDIDIRYYSIIYNLIDDMKAAVSGMMEPVITEHFLGNAEVLQVFKVSKVGKVAGCMVTEGTIKRGAGVRLVRDSVVIHEGTLKTLKRFKDEVAEVKEGMECGMAFEKYDDLKEGDVIEAFQLIEEKKEL